MTWLTPALGLIAGAVAIPALLILYFLKLRRRDVEVSTTLLWKKSVQDLQANAPFQMFRRNILLLLQLLALLAGLVALAQPELLSGAATASQHVLVIDRSASMSTLDETEGGETVTRLEKAKADAARFVESLSDGGLSLDDGLAGLLGGGEADEAMVIALGAGAEVVQPFTTDKRALVRSIRSIEPTDAGSTLDEAMRLAGAYAKPTVVEGMGLEAPATAPIRLWSDGRLSDVGRVQLGPRTPMTYLRVGAPDTGNLAITAMRADRAYDDPTALSIFVGVQGTDPGVRTADVELSIGDQVAAIREVNMAAGPEQGDTLQGGVVFTLERPEGGIATARLLRGGALASDDRARLVLPPARRLSVLMASEGNLFLRTALEGMPLANLEVVGPDGLGSADLESFDVVVLDGAAPPTLDGGAVRPGAYLAFRASSAMPGIGASGEAPEGATIVLDWRRDHPALRLAGLETLVIGNLQGIAVEPPARTIAEAEGGPAIVEVASPSVRALVCAFDAAETNWPFDPGFVLFTASAVEWLGREGETAVGAAATPGETLTTRLPRGARSPRLELPDGSTVGLEPTPDGRVAYGPLREAGLYAVRWSGEPGPRDAVENGTAVRPVAVNLLDPFESDVRASEEVALASRVVSGERAGDADGARRRLWPWLVGLALAVVMLEWWVYNRKVHV